MGRSETHRDIIGITNELCLISVLIGLKCEEKSVL